MSKKSNPSFFKLFACCIPVSGASKYIICDLQRAEYYTVPFEIYELLTKHENKTIYDIKENYQNLYDSKIDDIFDFFVKNDIGFYTNEPENFPDLNVNWETPEWISSAIIDWNENSKFDMKAIFHQLSCLRCKYIDLRFFDSVSMAFLEDIIQSLETTTFRNVDLYVKYSEDAKLNFLKEILYKYQRIGEIFVHSSPKGKESSIGRIHMMSKQIDSSYHCGLIHKEYFRVNTSLFMESQLSNNCLNKKVGIDIHGNIKNCPSMKKSYGNISYNMLKDVVHTDEFKQVWMIKKDDIHVCKDCEFRYICTDCRAFVQKLDDIRSKPLKCGYNPYTGQWEDWQVQEKNQNTIEHYQKQFFHS